MEHTKTGWIKYYRKIKDWKYYNNLKYEKLWLTFLLEANYDQQIFEGEAIERGELVFSYKTWESKFAKCKPIITVQNLRTMIKNLILSREISMRHIKEKNLSIIRVANFEKYQQKAAIDAEKTNIPSNIPFSAKLTHVEGNIVTDETNQIPLGLLYDAPCSYGDSHASDENQHTPDVNDNTLTNTTIRSKEICRGEKKEKKNGLRLSNIFSSINKNKQKTSLQERPEGTYGNTIKDGNGAPDGTPNAAQSFIKDVIDYLNKCAGKQFKYQTKTTVSLLRRRMAEGASLDDCRRVIDLKVKEWRGTTTRDGRRMEQYLRPKTLFSDENFENYINDIGEGSNFLTDREKEELRIKVKEKERQEKEKKIKDVRQKNDDEIDNLLNDCNQDDSNIIAGKFKEECFFVDEDIPF